MRESVFVCVCVFISRTLTPSGPTLLQYFPLRMGVTQSLYSPQGHMTRGLHGEITLVTAAVL